MKYGSVCSGIEAATVAWHPLGGEAQFFSEIEPFPCSVLKHHYPDVPNLGDMTKFKEWPDAVIDVLVGGTPCQSFSVAGLRKGLADPRGNLMLTFGAIASRYRPRWLVWENVPGVLSSNGGRDFGTFLGMLGQLGYGFAYRVLDAQYVRVQSHRRAVPQRRRRVFVVGYLGDWRRAAAVLFERESLSGNPAPSRKAGTGVTEVAGTLDANGGGTTRPAGNCNEPDFCVTMSTGQASAEIGIGIGTTLNCNHEAPIVTTQYGEVAGSLTARHDSSPCADRGQNVVAFAQNTRDEVRLIGGDGGIAGALAAEPGMKQQTYVAFQSKASATNSMNPSAAAPTLDKGKSDGIAVAASGAKQAVRRLTPKECERLQGFPDDYTLVPHNGKPAADWPRYKALGNSMAVNVMSWIGDRINLIEKLTEE